MHPEKIQWQWLLAIFALALLLRLALVIGTVGLGSPPDAGAAPDSVDYEWFAYSLSQGSGFTLPNGEPSARRPPGTSLTLAPIYLIFGRDYAVGRVFFALLSALTCVLVAQVGATYFGRYAGIGAGLILAVHPAHAYYVLHFLSETPSMFWSTLALVATLNVHCSNGVGLSAGAFWALSILSRPQLALFFPFALLLSLLSPTRWNELRTLVRICGFTLLLLLPWIGRNAYQLNTATLTTSFGPTLLGAHNQRTFSDRAVMGSWIPVSELEIRELPREEERLNSVAAELALEAVRQNVHKMPELILRKCLWFLRVFPDTPNTLVRWSFAISYVVTLPFLLIGIFRIGILESFSRNLLLSPLLGALATTILFYGSTRFRDGLLPVMVLLVILGVSSRGGRCSRGKGTSVNSRCSCL